MISTQTTSKTTKSSNSKNLIRAESSMPSHQEQLANLHRIEGQIRGITKMVEEGRYCLEILNQCRSVHVALEGVEKKIFKRFLQTCVKDTFKRSTNGDAEPLIEELVTLLERR